MRVEIGAPTAPRDAQERMRRTLVWEAPLLPGARRTSVPRWSAGPTWTPPGTILLVRHRALDGGRRIVTNDRVSPAGYEIEYDLGLVHQFAQPGTQRLIASDDGFFRTPFEGELDEGLRALGYVEDAPLPLLEGLEVRRDPAGGVTLVAGVDDPLYPVAEPLGHLGFVESYPINPRTAPDRRANWRLATLVRWADQRAWRHRYGAADGRPDGAAVLGGLLHEPASGFVALRLEADGTLASELLAPGARRTPSPTAAARWIGAPLRWSGRRPRAWAVRATLARARMTAARPRRLREEPSELLGYLRAEAAPTWSPLFCATHPVLDDQYATRSELEAIDMGYTVEGILGYIGDGPADRSLEALPREIKWAARFGKERRYHEGPRP
jgi:hypothetical protein